MIEHLAIIMDGNGRWATRRGMGRSAGHRAGAENIKRVVDAARAKGIKYLTVYAFSTENWKRPAAEVAALMALLVEFTGSMLDDMMKNNVRLRTIGRTDDLPLPARSALRSAKNPHNEYSRIRITMATNPNSSPITERMKSVCASGRYLAFIRLAMKPMPNQSPEPKAIRDIHN